MSQFSREASNTLPPVEEVELQPIRRDREKTSATFSSGIKEDDISMDPNSPDSDPADAENPDADILDSVLREMNAAMKVGITSQGTGEGGNGKKKPKWYSRKVEFDDGEHDEEEQDGVTVVSPPPSGHGYDFFCIMKRHGKFSAKDKYFPDEDIELLNQQRLIARVISALAPKPKLLPSNKDNRDMSRRGLRFVDLISKVPLGKVWHRTTQILAMLVFIINVFVSAYDVFRDFKHLHYKVPALLFTLLENAILLVMWLVLKNKRFQTKGERSVKHQQYIENIVHEVLMYPLLAIAAFGFATEKMYKTPTDAFGWAQLILLIVDVLELIWTQIIRLRMTYQVFRDIDSAVRRLGTGDVEDVEVVTVHNKKALVVKDSTGNSSSSKDTAQKGSAKDSNGSAGNDANALASSSTENILSASASSSTKRSPSTSSSAGLCSWNTAGWVLCRTYMTTMGSIVTFLVLLAMLILQVHYDNLEREDYHITWRSVVILLCFMLLPLFSIIVYILANAFWVMEILLRMNITVGNDGGFQGQLAKQYGTMVSDALTFSISKVQSNQERLEELRLTPLLKKIIYGALEPVNAFLLVFWQLIVVASVIVFDPFADAAVSLSLKIIFSFLLILANWHVFILAVVADVVVGAALLGALIYPCCLAVCCKNTHVVDPEELEDLKYF